jgi:hypothetical protein
VYGGSAGGTPGAAQDQRNMAAERGRCDSDIRHMFNLDMVFQPDFYHGESAVLVHILNGWEIAPILRKRSGTPFTVSNGVDANTDGNGNDRAQLIGDPHLPQPNLPRPSAAMWFNTAAFVQNPIVAGNPVDGNSPRNFLDNPGSTNIDMALSRTFRFTERYKLQFRGQATNAFNIVNLSGPNTTWGTRNLARSIALALCVSSSSA